MSKKLLSKWLMLLALVVPLALVACGGAEELEQAVDEASEQVEEAVDEAASEVEDAVDEVMDEPEYDTAVYGNLDEINLEGTEVSFWHRFGSGARQEEIAGIVADFNAENPYGITINESAEGGYGDIYDKMIAGLTTGEVPGLVIAYQNQAAAYQVADGLVSLDPYLNHPEYGLSPDAQADFFQAFIDSDRLPQFDGEAFGFPPNRSMEVLFYNAEYLAELGYDAPPATPEAFAEMVCAAAETPFSKATEASGQGMQIDTDASSFAALVFARGGDVYDYDAGEFTYNTPEAVAALTFIQDLVDQGCIGQIAEDFGDQTDFGNGKLLFTQGSSSGIPFYASAVNDGETGGFEWSVSAIPYTTDNPVQNIYGASISIPKTTPEQQLAAWLFLKYWTEPEQQARWSRASNYFPVRNSVADGLDEYFEENPAFEAAFQLLPFTKAEPPIAGYDNVRDVVEEAFINIIFNGADAESSLAELDVTANQIQADSAP